MSHKVCKYICALLFALFLNVHCNAGENKTGQQKSSFQKDTALMNFHIAIGKSNTISADSALMHLNIALALAKKHDLQKQMGVIWGKIALANLNVGNFDICRVYFDSAFRLNDRLKDGELTCILNTGIAGLYQYTSNYAKAASHYFRALEAVQEYKLENTRPGLLVYINLGTLMMVLDEDSLSRKYLLQAKGHALSMHPIDSPLLNMILIDIGETDVQLDAKAATAYYKKILAQAEKVKDISFSYRMLISLCLNYERQRKLDSAEHYLLLAKAIAEPGVPMLTAEVTAGRIAYYRKDYALALKHLQKALSMTGGEDYEFMEQIYELYSAVYVGQKQYQKAYEYHVKYMEQHQKKMDGRKKIVTDCMLSFQSLEHEKRIMQKQAEISMRESAIKRQRFLVAVMCMVSVLLGIILILAYRNYQHKKTLLSEQMRALVQDQEIERLKAEAEGADNERSRIAYDIHDGVLVRLANVKMNIAGLAPNLPAFTESERYQDVIGQLDTATRELRNTAHNLMPEILLEEGMAQAIFYFCKATEQASGLNIKFQQVGDTLPRLQAQVEMAIYRIVQGLIQNIIQHANATSALVQLQYADYLCSITVEDNGKGMTDIQKDEGYGIKSIRNRIKILRGSIDIDSQVGQGTTVYLEFDARPFLQDSQASR